MNAEMFMQVNGSSAKQANPSVISTECTIRPHCLVLIRMVYKPNFLRSPRLVAAFAIDLVHTRVEHLTGTWTVRSVRTSTKAGTHATRHSSRRIQAAKTYRPTTASLTAGSATVLSASGEDASALAWTTSKRPDVWRNSTKYL